MRRRVRFRVWHGVPSVVVAAGAGVVTNVVTGVPSVALVAALVAFVVVQAGFAVWQGHRELAAARGRRAGVLSAVRPGRKPISELGWLSAAVSPTRLWARDHELTGLVQWCTAGADVLRIVGGPAGVGKSRLAVELADALPKSWAAGWLVTCTDLVDQVRACDEPALVIVDDADTVPGLVELVDSVRSWPATMRVLLLTRDAHGLSTWLGQHVKADARPVVDTNPLILKPVGEEGDRRRWFADAVVGYARCLGVLPPELADQAVGEDGDTMLLLHARALLAVCGRAGVQTLSLRDVAEHLLGLETRHWTAAKPADATEQTLTEVILALTLIPATYTADAVRVLRSMPRFSDADSEQLHTVAQWAQHRYPPGPDHRLNLRPHLITEWLWLTQLSTHLALLDDHADSTASVVAALTRACHTFPDLASSLVIALRSRPHDLAANLTLATTMAPTHPAVDEALAELVGTIGPDRAEPVINLGVSTRFPRLRCALAALAVSYYRALVETQRPAHVSDLARALISLGVRLHEVGSWDEALTATEEALGYYRELAQSQRETYLPDLATTLNNLGNRLREVGRRDDALAATEEALKNYRELTRRRPDMYLPDLATTLNNLGTLLREVGRMDKALTTTEEALTYRRGLAHQQRETYLPDLATTLNNLGTLLREVGRMDEALTTTEEALTYFRELATHQREPHLPNVALTLNNLGNCLREVGRWGEALTTTQEALTYYRELAQSQRETYLPDLATTLNNLGTLLREVGRMDEALTTTEEALTYYRELATRQRDAHLPSLAGTLANLGILLNEVDRWGEALTTTQEALTYYRELATRQREAYLPDLASTLNNLGLHLSDVGQWNEALTAGEEALEYYRELVVDQREAHLPHLAYALNNLGTHLSDVGQRDEELAVRKEVVGLWRECAYRYPDLYGSEYRRSVDRLCQLLEQSGSPDDAIQARLDLQLFSNTTQGTP